ncbi:MAG TPA: hypothetical protein VGS00_03760 [Thermoanaerobaculia bacterium]|nr:hypothetical protein [Thermoanaerobaculia bacterium]
MKLPRQALLATLATLATLAASGMSAETPARARITRSATPNAVASSFSTEVPLVQRYSPPASGQSNTLVLNAAHSFNVTLTAINQHNGNAQGAGLALSQTDTFGYFSLPSITGNPSNPEVFVKILDARGVNGNYWVFYGHLTDLIYDITVKENATGRTKTYHKDAGVTPGGALTTDFPSSATVTSNTEDAQAIASTPNAFVRTAVDISNNTNATVSATYQYSYTCTSPTCSPVNGFYRTPERTIPLLAFDNFHQDDIVQYLGSQGLLQPGADQGSTGTLLVTFNNVPSNIGWEATVEARTYNRVLEPDPLRGTVGFGMNASLFFESTNTTLTGTVRDTRPSPSLEGSLTSHVGIRNTDVSNPPKNAPVTVDLTLYDPATGHRVGNTVTLTNIQPGDVRLVNDLFTVAAVPASVQSVILFADTRNPSTAPTIEGFILIQDTYSGDTRFHEMKCADLVRCGP